MSLQRRHVLIAASALPLGVHAHHGWSSFDADRPLYLEGAVRKVRWQNPHAELELELDAESEELELKRNCPQRSGCQRTLRNAPSPRRQRPWMAARCWPKRCCRPARTASGKLSWRR